jgi:hypothetical protein
MVESGLAFYFNRVVANQTSKPFQTDEWSYRKYLLAVLTENLLNKTIYQP